MPCHGIVYESPPQACCALRVYHRILGLCIARYCKQTRPVVDLEQELTSVHSPLQNHDNKVRVGVRVNSDWRGGHTCIFLRVAQLLHDVVTPPLPNPKKI